MGVKLNNPLSLARNGRWVNVQPTTVALFARILFTWSEMANSNGTPAFRIPEAFAKPLAHVVELTDADFSTFAAAVTNLPVSLNSESAAQHLSSSGVLDTGQARALLALVVHTVSLAELFETTDLAVADAVAYAYDRNENAGLADRLVELIRSDSIILRAKVSRLANEPLPRFNALSTIVDLRPIFSEEVEGPSSVQGLVIVATVTLRLDDSRNEGQEHVYPSLGLCG